MMRFAPCDRFVPRWLTSRARSRRPAVAAAAAAVALLVAGGRAAAHTKAIGYCSDGCGSVTFWFQSWHSCVSPFTEGSFNLVGINGNTFPSTTVPFTLSTCVKPACLIDGVNNFYACNSNPMGLCTTDEDNRAGSKWQGVTFGNLQAGDYLFTYIPIANPSADWDPATPGVLSNVMTVLEDCSCVSAPAGMVAWWPLDETSPGTAVEIRSGLDGTYEPGTGPYPQPTTGRVVNGLLFANYVDQSYLSAPDGPELHLGTGDFTIDAWVKTPYVGCESPILSKGASYFSPASDIGFEWGLTSVGESQYLVLRDDSGSWSHHWYYDSNACPTDDVWHHLAVVVERNATAPNVTFYDDGVAFPDMSGTLPVAGSVTSSAPVYLAKFGGATTRSSEFNGIIDEVEIFNRALSAEEVQLLHGAGSAGKCKCADGLEGDGGNDTCETAYLLPFASFIDLDLSKINPDWYRIDVPPWSKMTVVLGFTNAMGDVNAYLYSSCGGSIVKSAAGTGDGEVLVWTNSTLATLTRFVQVVVAPNSPTNCTRYSLQWWTAKSPYIWDDWIPLPNPIGGVRPR